MKELIGVDGVRRRWIFLWRRKLAKDVFRKQRPQDAAAGGRGRNADYDAQQINYTFEIQRVLNRGSARLSVGAVSLIARPESLSPICDTRPSGLVSHSANSRAR